MLGLLLMPFSMLPGNNGEELGSRQALLDLSAYSTLEGTWQGLFIRGWHRAAPFTWTGGGPVEIPESSGLPLIYTICSIVTYPDGKGEVIWCDHVSYHALVRRTGDTVMVTYDEAHPERRPKSFDDPGTILWVLKRKLDK